MSEKVERQRIVRLSEAISLAKKTQEDQSIVWELKRLQVEYGNPYTYISGDKLDWPEVGFDSTNRRVIFA